MTNTHQVVLVDTSGGSSITLTLPDSSTIGKKMYYIKLITTYQSGVTVDIVPSGTDTIEGSSSVSLVDQYDYIVLVSDGSGVWYIFGKNY